MYFVLALEEVHIPPQIEHGGVQAYDDAEDCQKCDPSTEDGVHDWTPERVIAALPEPAPI